MDFSKAQVNKMEYQSTQNHKARKTTIPKKE